MPIDGEAVMAQDVVSARYFGNGCMVLVARWVSGALRRSGCRAGAAMSFCVVSFCVVSFCGVLFCAVMSVAMAEEGGSPSVPVAPLTIVAPLTPIAAAPPPTLTPPTLTLPTVTPPTLSMGAAAKPEGAVMAAFLDRLMVVESGGRDDARNPRSTAVGPYQFIESTFLDVARRHFAAETASLAPVQILALRTNRPFARRAAEAFTRDNADILANNALQTTPTNLRLSFLVGPNAAVRVLQAEAATPVIQLLGAKVVQANPFMAGMGASDLLAWSERSIAGGGSATGEIGARPLSQRVAARVSPSLPSSLPVPKPVAQPNCKLELASCRRWIALASKKPAVPSPKRIAAALPAPRRAATR